MISTLIVSRHVFEDCVAIEATRVREGIRDFMVECRNRGRSRASTYHLYINGMDANLEKVGQRDHLMRGKSLDNLTSAWLSTWE